jgi:hypothetical protein
MVKNINSKSKKISKKLSSRKLSKKVTSTSKSVKSYKTMFNGRFPFLVKVNNTNKTLEIYKQPSYDQPDYSILVHNTKFQKVMLGKCNAKLCDYVPGELGNTILAVLGGNKYLYIGEKVYEFKTKQPILTFDSPVGNNDSPYPFAKTKDQTILFVENAVISTSMLDESKFNEEDSVNWDKKDPYYYYYAFFEHDMDKQRKLANEHSKLTSGIQITKKY